MAAIGKYSDAVSVEKITDDSGIKLVITSSGDDIQGLTLYIAVYNVDHSLKGVIKADAVKEADGILTVISGKPTLADGETYKMMLWDNDNSPVIDVIKNE